MRPFLSSMRGAQCRCGLDVGGPSRLPLVRSSPVRFQRVTTSATSAPRATQTLRPHLSAQVRHLPKPSPQLSTKDDALQASVENARLRKVAFGKAEVERLAEIRDRISAIAPELETVKKERNELSEKITEISRTKNKLIARKRTDKDVEATIDEELEKLAAEVSETAAIIKKTIKPRETDLLAEYHALEAESDALRLRSPNGMQKSVPHGPASAAIVRHLGGDMSLLPRKMRATFGESKHLAKFGGGIPLAQLSVLDQGTPDPTRDHQRIAEQLGWIDREASRQVVGTTSWPYLSGPLALLEHALVAFAMHNALGEGYQPVTVPDVVRRDILDRTGFAPREGGGGQVFWVHEDGVKQTDDGSENPDELALAGTAEVPLAGLCAGKTFKLDALPYKLVATSHAFRAEAGARGQESRGLYRVHQFTKVELFVVCKSSENGKHSDSSAMLEEIRRIQGQTLAKLGMPFRLLDMPSEELGASAYRKYDFEIYMPGRGSWGEVSSASMCTDYQSRRLHIFHDHASGKHTFAETLNGTAAAIPRLIVALLENYGVDASTNRIRLPVTLKRFWLGDANDVVWVNRDDSPVIPMTAPAKEDSPPPRPSALGRAMAHVREAANRSGVEPTSVVLAFLILHELTAIVPVILIFFALWSLGAGEAVMTWLQETAHASGTSTGTAEPASQVEGLIHNLRGYLQSYMDEGLLRAERVGRRYGLFGFEKGSQVDAAVAPSLDKTALAGTFANAVAAYAIVKILFPLRIAACIALAAPFARVCINPIKRMMRRFRDGKHAKKPEGATKKAN